MSAAAHVTLYASRGLFGTAGGARAVDDVSLSVTRRETLALVVESGTILLQAGLPLVAGDDNAIEVDEAGEAR